MENVVTHVFGNRSRLKELRVAHRDLDVTITKLSLTPHVDQLRIRRLKKRETAPERHNFKNGKRAHSRHQRLIRNTDSRLTVRGRRGKERRGSLFGRVLIREVARILRCMATRPDNARDHPTYSAINRSRNVFGVPQIAVCTLRWLSALFTSRFASFVSISYDAIESI